MDNKQAQGFYIYKRTWTRQASSNRKLRAYLWCFGALSISGVFYVRDIQYVRILQTRKSTQLSQCQCQLSGNLKAPKTAQNTKTFCGPRCCLASKARETCQEPNLLPVAEGLTCFELNKCLGTHISCNTRRHVGVVKRSVVYKN